ncbi:hypothetical protein, partial [Photobacterium halotolerans]|uniref:hypothetical protein n=1 Tax=Photobacterium halotolerans TaxID=265726 RepID=UPI0013726D09
DQVISVSDESGTMKEEITQLYEQGFQCYSSDIIRAENEQEAKKKYLQQFTFCGINGRVVALHIESGQEIWREKPRGDKYKASGFVTILVHSDKLICGSNGCVFALCPLTGARLWTNELPGLGFSQVSLATTQANITVVEKVVTRDSAPVTH